MSAAISGFLAQGLPGGEVHLVGPMLTKAPVLWPDIPTVFVDGGAQWRGDWPSAHSAPTLSLGDGDSLGAQTLDILLDTRKDVSDLAYALELLSGLNVRSLRLSGFLGGRRDHEWINFGVVARFMSDRQDARAVFDSEVSLLAPGNHSIDLIGEFSVASFVDTEITLKGPLEYPLTSPTLLPAHSSLGLSNRADGSCAITCDKPTLVFHPLTPH